MEDRKGRKGEGKERFSRGDAEGAKGKAVFLRQTDNSTERLGEPALPLEWKEALEGEAVPNRMPRACLKTAHHRFALQFVGGLGERILR